MKNFILPILVSIFIISSCSTASLRPDVIDRSSAQKLESAFKKLTRSKKLERLCEMIDEDLGFI